MSKWENLKNSLYSYLDNMTHEDWVKWKNKQQAQRDVRHAQKRLEALIHALKTSLENDLAEKISFDESASPSECLLYVNDVEINNDTNLSNDVFSIFSFAA